MLEQADEIEVIDLPPDELIQRLRVGPGPSSAGLIRAARRMAGRLRAPWYAVFVETPAFRRLPEIERDHVDQHLDLAASLGGTAVRFQGQRVSAEMVRFARRESVTQIIVGKPSHPPWRDMV